MLFLRDESKMFESLPGEEWMLEAQARLSVKIGGFPAGGAPGCVSVRNRRVLCEPAGTSITRAMAEIHIQDIATIWKTRNCLVLPNSFEIATKCGACYKFTSWSRNAIVALLAEKEDAHDQACIETPLPVVLRRLACLEQRRWVSTAEVSMKWSDVCLTARAIAERARGGKSRAAQIAALV